jgi:hypothetical protein
MFLEVDTHVQNMYTAEKDLGVLEQVITGSDMRKDQGNGG